MLLLAVHFWESFYFFLLIFLNISVLIYLWLTGNYFILELSMTTWCREFKFTCHLNTWSTSSFDGVWKHFSIVHKDNRILSDRMVYKKKAHKYKKA